jgi:hypothetical protein
MRESPYPARRRSTPSLAVLDDRDRPTARSAAAFLDADRVLDALGDRADESILEDLADDAPPAVLRVVERAAERDPNGAFPQCRSPLGVYDLNGNAAEHMNLPLREDQMASRGREYGVTEMKGSWFVADAVRAHEDWCRWRAPFWHGTRVMDEHGHHNYHLGFRCCKTRALPPSSAR